MASSPSDPLPTGDVSPPPDSQRPVSGGFFGKPLIEKAKLIGLFLLIALLVYYSHPTPVTFLAGGVLVIIGALIRVWAAGHLTRDQKLTTSGPYEHTRNPFYLGRFLILIGFAIMSGLGNLPARIIVIGALIIFFGFYMPRKEEREGGRLKNLFGEDYTRWKTNVPQLFPRLTPYRMYPRPWSRELFMGGDAQHTGNKELWTTVATALLIVAFYWRLQNPL